MIPWKKWGGVSGLIGKKTKCQHDSIIFEVSKDWTWHFIHCKYDSFFFTWEKKGVAIKQHCTSMLAVMWMFYSLSCINHHLCLFRVKEECWSLSQQSSSKTYTHPRHIARPSQSTHSIDSHVHLEAFGLWEETREHPHRQKGNMHTAQNPKLDLNLLPTCWKVMVLITIPQITPFAFLICLKSQYARYKTHLSKWQCFSWVSVFNKQLHCYFCTL